MAYPETPVGTGGPYANAGRGLDKFAAAVTQGLQTGQQMRGAALQQRRTENELAEYDRQQRIRSGVGALDRSNPEVFARAAADLYGQEGEADKAFSMEEQARKFAAQSRAKLAGEAAAALRAGDFNALSERTKALGLFGIDHKILGADPKTGKFRLEMYTPLPGGKGGVMPKRVTMKGDELLDALMIAADPDALSAMKNVQAAQLKRSEIAAISRIGAGGGAGQGHHTLLGEVAGPKGERMPVTLDQKTGKHFINGRAIPDADFERLRWLDKVGSSGAGALGPRTAALTQAIGKQQVDSMTDIAQVGDQRYAALQRAAAMDAADALIAKNRTLSPQDAMLDIVRNIRSQPDVTRDQLLSMGYHELGVDAALRRLGRTQ